MLRERRVIGPSCGGHLHPFIYLSIYLHEEIQKFKNCFWSPLAYVKNIFTASTLELQQIVCNNNNNINVVLFPIVVTTFRANRITWR